MELTQSQTAEPIVFLMVDSTDHVTAKTGLSPTVVISKNGGAFGAPAGAVTELSLGWYVIAADAADTDTLGPLIVHASATGADPVDLLYQVVKQNRRVASMDLVLAKTTNLTGLNDIAATAIVSAGAIQTLAGHVVGVDSVETLATDAIDADSLATDAVAEIVAGLNGTGARTVTITVNDGTTALESATVRMTKGAESYTQVTNVSGQCTFNVDDGTWVVAITLSGYSYAGTSLVVDGTETATYSMTALSITPPTTPDQLTGYLVCYATDGTVLSGVSFTVKQITDSEASGIAYGTSDRTVVSDVSGLVQFPGMWAGAVYLGKRSSGEWVEIEVPTTGTTFELPSILGP